MLVICLVSKQVAVSNAGRIRFELSGAVTNRNLALQSLHIMMLWALANLAIVTHFDALPGKRHLQLGNDGPQRRSDSFSWGYRPFLGKPLSRNIQCLTMVSSSYLKTIVLYHDYISHYIKWRGKERNGLDSLHLNHRALGAYNSSCA